MKRWQLKAVVQKGASFLPFPHHVNFLFQKYVTKGVNLTDNYFTDRLEHANAHIRAFGRCSPGKKIAASLELGTGWYPVIPVSLFLHGVDRAYTVDVTEHCGAGNIVATLRMFRDYEERGKLGVYVEMQAERRKELLRLARKAEQLTQRELLDNLHIHYLVTDARRLPLPAQSVSLITSNNTLEHIYPEVLRQILLEFKRLAAEGCIMSHFIDMSDHFAHFDRSITIYNYLQYSKRQWKWIDNSIQPQNRLRISDYRRIYADLGIPITEELCREGSMDELSTVRVHQEFRAIPPRELAISHCLLVSKMAADGVRTTAAKTKADVF